MPNDPSVKSAEAQLMSSYWDVVNPLMAGTKGMREAGNRLLPKFPKEEDDDYKCRLNASTLLPAYSETVSNMVGRVFANPIAIGEDVPATIADYLDNVDLQGNNLQVWSMWLFTKALSHGLCFVLVDNTATQEYRTKAEEKAANVRPFSKIVKPEQFIGAKSGTVEGELRITEFRFMEMVETIDPENQFNTVLIEQIKVLEIGRWSTYRKKKSAAGKEEWFLDDEGATSLPIVPIIPLYTNREGFMLAKPKLMELAYMNVKHWQSQSDQDNILHVARVPMLAFIGVDNPATNPNQPEFVVGSSSGSYLPMGADMKFVEHSGAAIEAGAESLKSLVEDMRMAGAKLLQKERQATKTAAQANEEAAQEMSPLEAMAGMLEDCLDQMIYIYSMMTGESVSGHIAVNGNFDVDFAPEVTLPHLKAMADSRYISEQTLFEETKRRGVLKDSITWEDEKKRIDLQGPALGTMTDVG